ncbi:hypothetical protein BCR39DRAFT_34176 [Naematelia encephala]|uniref:Alpha-1,6-mannosyltransferase n=1 Tax=Naematelia encephala TaxID=71784 RepID=A0A1Y2BM02_9TREE|nr:hypothetical protein BCR39DRAFT_34176 [Naematelia encephala]
MIRSKSKSNVIKLVLILLLAITIYLACDLRFPLQPKYDTPEAQAFLASTDPQDLNDLYEEIRLDYLVSRQYNATITARSIRAPEYLAYGTLTFDLSRKTYIQRLREFTLEYFQHAPERIRDSLGRSIDFHPGQYSVSRRGRNREGLPHKIWSTTPKGFEGVQDMFRLWSTLLPLPLSRKLLDHLGGTDPVYLRPAVEGAHWEVTVPDDDGVDRLMSQWTGESTRRGIKGEGQWENLWGSLPLGVLRADVFRYMSMLIEGGIYADSDTAPMVHPYLWGVEATSALHPDLEAILPYITKSPLDPGTHAQSPRGYLPPYGSRSRSHPSNPFTILHPEISLVVAIEWDSHIVRKPNNPLQWRWYRFTRSLNNCCYARNLQFAQHLLMAKPFHPVFLDVLQMISSMADKNKDDLEAIGALDLTGPGPFTDAVLRYLLVQYGVTPTDLRNLRGPTRIGDVLILGEESLLVGDRPWAKFIKHVQRFLTSFKIENERDPWFWGIGYWSWKSGGRVYARHGLVGSWK